MDNMNLNMDLEAPSVAPAPQKKNSKKTIIACVIVALISILGTAAVFLVPSWLKSEDKTSNTTVSTTQTSENNNDQAPKTNQHDDAWYKAYYDKFAEYFEKSFMYSGNIVKGMLNNAAFKEHTKESDGFLGVPTFKETLVLSELGIFEASKNSFTYDEANTIWKEHFDGELPKDDLYNYCETYVYKEATNTFELNTKEECGIGGTENARYVNKYIGHKDTEDGFKLEVKYARLDGSYDYKNDNVFALTLNDYSIVGGIEAKDVNASLLDKYSDNLDSFYMNFKTIDENRSVLINITKNS